MHAVNTEQLKPGVVIVYRLLPNQLPTHPKMEWRGRVKKIDLLCKRIIVDILNAGYEGDEEPVFFEQITRVEHEE